MSNTINEELRGKIWSTSLKYLDYLNHTKADGEEYYSYRDSKARELSEEVMKLIQHTVDKAVIEALSLIWGAMLEDDEYIIYTNRKVKDGWELVPLKSRIKELKGDNE